jgi:threonine aldolase
MVGGGMRQAGVIAAGALYALDHMVDRLADDHRLAKMLAEGMASFPGIDLDLSTVQTNIVIFRVAASGHRAEAVVERLAARGVLCETLGADSVRFVTHYGIEQSDIERALTRVSSVMREL